MGPVGAIAPPVADALPGMLMDGVMVAADAIAGILFAPGRALSAPAGLLG
jgi:hypothetical protein